MNVDIWAEASLEKEYINGILVAVQPWKYSKEERGEGL